MKYNNYLLLTIILLVLISCAKEDAQKSIIKEKSLDLQVLAAYEEGKEALDKVMLFLQQKNLMKQKYYFPIRLGT